MAEELDSPIVNLRSASGLALLISVAVHGSLLVLLALKDESPTTNKAASTAETPERQLSIALLRSGGAPPVEAARQEAPSPPEDSAPPALTPRLGLLLNDAAPHASPRRETATTVEVLTAQGESDEGFATHGANEDVGGANGKATVAPRLTLKQLGVEPGALAWLHPPSTPSDASVNSKRDGDLASAERRLELSMRQSTMNRDGKLGLGPECPLLAELRQRVRSSALPNETHAVLRLTIDSNGKMRVRALESSTAFDAWNRVADEAVKALGGKLASLKPPGQGIEIDITVSSSVRLPSGRKPGFGVDLFGLPLGGKGGGTRLKLFEPSVGVSEVDVPVAPGRTVALPVLNLGINPLGLDGDLVDIGANAQRIVQVHVIAQRPLQTAIEPRLPRDASGEATRKPPRAPL